MDTNYIPSSDIEIMMLGLLQDWQQEIIFSKIKFKTVVASRQIGKSTAIRVLIYKYAIENPGSEILILASTLKQVKALHWRPLFLSNEPLFPQHLISELNKTDLVVELTNGTRISCASTEAAQALRGRTANLIVIDEAGHVELDEVLEIVQPIVTRRNGDIVLIGTPSGKAHPFYMYHQYGLLGSPFFKKGFRSWTVTVYDATVPNKESSIEQAKSILSPSQFATEYECSFEAQEGLVYKLFDSNKNRSDKGFNPELPIFIGLDFNIGVMNAVVTQLYNTEVGEVVHVIDEIRLRNTSTQEMATEINRRYGSHVKFPIVVYPDASGQAGKSSAGVSVTDITILKSNNLKVYVPASNPLIQDRVNNVNNMICSANGTRRLFISPRCKYLIQALTSQTYDDNGKPVKGKGEADLSGPNDAIGYLIHNRFNMKRTTTIIQG